MKQLYTGPKPLIPELLGKMYAFTAIVLVFSAALPILYPLLTLYLGSAYVADKVFLLRICRKPIPYGATFVHETLWWVHYALVLKLALAVWAFGSLPGERLSEVLAGLRASGNNASSIYITSLQFAVSYNNDDNWFGQRIATIGSAWLVGGLGVLLVFMLGFFLHDHGAAVLGEVVVTSCRHLLRYWGCARVAMRGTNREWPTEYPPFSHVLRGGAKSQRVRILKQASSDGRGEVLVLESDIDPSSWRNWWNCVTPPKLLLYLFGIRTFRHKLQSEEEFAALEQKPSVIVGRANMSYAPHFMPDYQVAFAYAGEEVLSGRQNSGRSSNAGSHRDARDRIDSIAPFSAPRTPACQIAPTCDATLSANVSPIRPSPTRLTPHRLTPSFGGGPDAPDRDDEWECQQCTFINNGALWECEMCGSARPGAQLSDARSSPSQGSVSLERARSSCEAMSRARQSVSDVV